MEIDEICRQMKNLWKKTFGDNDDYIDLIFSNYFKREFIEFRVEDGQIIAAMLAIPYEFLVSGKIVHGLYLCGLATCPEYRGQGIMSGLINAIHERFQNSNFYFSFLIPAGQSLIHYYENNGYLPLILRSKIMIQIRDNNEKKLLNKSINKDIKKDDIILKNLETKNDLEVERICDFIMSCEASNKNNFEILHTRKNIEIIIKENELSGGDILYIFDEWNVIHGVIFMTIEDERKRLKIPRIFHKNPLYLKPIIEYITQKFSFLELDIYFYPEEKENYTYIFESLKNEIKYNYGNLSSVIMTDEIYGMVRTINENENLKFTNNSSRDLEYSILVNPEKNENMDSITSAENPRNKFTKQWPRISMMLD